MARIEADREDLMREAVALVRRVAFRAPHRAQPIVAGYRATGWLSIYFGPDPVYQFDDRSRLRRAFVDGVLYRTQGTTLAQLVRQRTPTETVLVRRDLDERELAEFRRSMLDAMVTFREQLIQRETTPVQQVPPDDQQLANDILQSLNLILSSTEFLAPPIPGKL
jgi:hypothetical protein